MKMSLSLLKDLTQVAAFGAAAIYFVVRMWKGELTPKLAISISNGRIIKNKEQVYVVIDFSIENTGDINIYAQDVRVELLDPDSADSIVSKSGQEGLKLLYLEPRQNRKFKKYRFYNIEANTHLNQTAVLPTIDKHSYFVRCTLHGKTRWSLQTGEWRTTALISQSDSIDNSSKPKAEGGTGDDCRLSK